VFYGPGQRAKWAKKYQGLHQPRNFSFAALSAADMTFFVFAAEYQIINVFI